MRTICSYAYAVNGRHKNVRILDFYGISVGSSNQNPSFIILSFSSTYLNDTDRHSDGRILKLIELGRHGQSSKGITQSTRKTCSERKTKDHRPMFFRRFGTLNILIPNVCLTVRTVELSVLILFEHIAPYGNGTIPCMIKIEREFIYQGAPR